MIDKVKGIGPKTASILMKLGINTIEDLLTYYPFRFDVLEKSDIRSLEQGDKIIIDGIAETLPSISFFSKKMNRMQFRVNTGDYVLRVTIFNRAFLKNKILIGTSLTIIGKYDKKNNAVVASDIKFGMLPPIPKIEPIYHSVAGLSSNQIRQFIGSVISQADRVNSYVPDYLVEKYKLGLKGDSIREIHFPGNDTSLKKALNYLKYEELFVFMLKMNYLKKIRQSDNGIKHEIDRKKIDDFINKLPFSLTEDQLKSVNAIYDDMTSSQVMKRLLQGDVGSGKTIVAVISLYMNYISGMQGAFMAPTEVLAIQHYNSLTKILVDTDIKIALLTGNIKSKERKEILSRVLNQEIDIVVGTHALFSDDVIYKTLGLVVTDEQHRFGVNQRTLLTKKGESPDILYLSATPIPRTYALTIYGDMDISSIHTKPTGRLPIKTYIRTTQQIKEVLDMMQNEIRSGSQIYVIAPLIEESDKIDLENVMELKDKMEKALGKISKVGLLHGRMDTDEKEKIMNAFKNNEFQILISTTVIEVGIDVPNANMIVIFDSYRFGLSQLHQLRGRVGRSDKQSQCVLISDKEVERLKILEKTIDGFKISEEDFRLRGSGDLFGTRQSGDMKFMLADFKKDFAILIRAKEDSQELLNSKDYKVGKYPLIREMLVKSMKLE